MANSKSILIAVGVAAVAGIAYLAFDGRIGVDTDEGVQGTMAPAEQHQMSKTQYYDDLNRRQFGDDIEAFAEIAAKYERAPAEAQMVLQEEGLSKAEYDAMMSQIRNDEELNEAFEAAKAKALAAQQ